MPAASEPGGIGGAERFFVRVAPTVGAAIAELGEQVRTGRGSGSFHNTNRREHLETTLATFRRQLRDVQLKAKLENLPLMTTLIRLDIPPVSAAHDFANVPPFIRSNPLKQQKHARIIGNLPVISGQRLVTLL
jgi:hypothetical protein